MGLDVDLYLLPEFDTNKVVLHDQESWKVWSQAQQGPKSHITKEESLELSARCEELAVRMGLPFDIGEQIERKMEKINLPSEKYPNDYLIGCWGSGYGGGGIDTILKATVGRGLYDAFPEARGSGTYIKPDWHRSRQILQEILTEFCSTGYEDQKFLTAIGFTVCLGEDFLPRFSPQSTEGQHLLSTLHDSLSPQSVFSDYCKLMEVILETIEYVLAQPDMGQYILHWSA